MTKKGYKKKTSTKGDSKFVKFVKKNKVAIMVGGATIVSVATVLLVKNHNDKVEAEKNSNYLRNALDAGMQIPKNIEFKVNKHLKNLPEGYKISVEKLAAAKDNGIKFIKG